MLAEDREAWNREWQKGYEEGRRIGFQEEREWLMLRLLRQKYGYVPPEIEERVRSTDVDWILERMMTSERLQDIFSD